MGCPLAARGLPSGVGCRRSEEFRPSTIGGAVSRGTRLHRAVPSSPREGRPRSGFAWRLPASRRRWAASRSAAASRLPREPPVSRRRPAPEGAFCWRVAEVAPRSRLPPPRVRLPEGGFVQGGWGPLLPPPRSGVLLSLRPIGSSEEDPAFRPNAASVQSGSDERCPSRGRGGSSPRAVPIRSVRGETPSACRLVVGPGPLSPRPEGWFDGVSELTGDGLSMPPDPANTRAEAWDLPPAKAGARLPEGRRGFRSDGKPPGRGSSRQHRGAGKPPLRVPAEAGCR